MSWNFIEKETDLTKAKLIPNMHMHTFWCGHATLKVKQLADFLNDNELDGYVNEHLSVPKRFLESGLNGGAYLASADLLHTNNCGTIQRVFWNRFFEQTTKHSLKVGVEVDYLHGFEDDTKQMIQDFETEINKYGKQLNHISLSLHHLRGCSLYYAESINHLLTQMSKSDLIKTYYDDTIKGIKKLNPQFVCHPGLLGVSLFHRVNVGMTDEEIKLYVKKYKELVDACIKQGVAVEINTSAFGKGMSDPYMPYEVFTYAKENGAKFVAASDTHHISQGFQYFDQLYDFLKKEGITQIYKVVNQELVAVNL